MNHPFLNLNALWSLREISVLLARPSIRARGETIEVARLRAWMLLHMIDIFQRIKRCYLIAMLIAKPFHSSECLKTLKQNNSFVVHCHVAFLIKRTSSHKIIKSFGEERELLGLIAGFLTIHHTCVVQSGSLEYTFSGNKVSAYNFVGRSICQNMFILLIWL